VRLTNTFSGRPAYYDRNPLDASSQSLQVGIAPLGTTVEITYTVPTGRKAIVTHGYLRLRRVTVAAPVGIAQDFAGTAASSMSVIRNTVNTVDAVEHRDFGASRVCLAGLTVTTQAADLSTGGTMDHESGLSIIEFDA
jgi:hypothetical protein